MSRSAAPSLVEPAPDQPATEPIPTSRRTPIITTRILYLLGTLAVVAGAVWLRFHHQSSSYELGIDELQYAFVGNSFAAGQGPELFGQPFFLHPPLFFVLLGSLIGQPVAFVSVPFVVGLRWVELVFAGLNALLVVSIARRVVGPSRLGYPAALIAGALYALDPFVVRFDSRLLLEAPAMTATLAGLLAALLAVERAGRARVIWLVVAGLMLGVAVTTKSTSALTTTLPMLLVFATGRVLRRREAAGVIALQISVYNSYVWWTAGTGRFTDWFDATLGGVFRAVGVRSETGFNAPGAPSFVERVTANLSQFSPSYLLIAVAGGYLVMALYRDLDAGASRGRHAAGTDATAATTRLLVYWLVGVAASVAYTFVFAEIEEQTFYLFAVPSTLVIAVMITRAARRGPRVQVLMAALVTVLLAGSSAVWWNVHVRTTDDAYLEVAEFLAPSANTGTVIALGEQTAQFVLPGFLLVTIDDAERTHARYALVSTQLAKLGLAPISTQVIDDLAEKHPVAFQASGRTSGDLIVFDLTRKLPR
jgi:4-amino-4-deoxy-L-arabinose transferase-like glycosyltransferase